MFKHPSQSVVKSPRFTCNEDLLSALESGFLAVWSTAQQHSQGANPSVMPGQMHTGNHRKTFPAWLQRLQRQGEIPQNHPPPSLSWHFLIENSKSGGLDEADKLQSLVRAFCGCYTCPSAFHFLRLEFYVFAACLSVWVGGGKKKKRCSEPS